MRRLLLPALALLLVGCPEPTDDDDSAAPEEATTRFAGTLTAVGGGPLEGCQVGPELDDVVLSSADGRFEIDVLRGGVAHVRCPDATMRSFQLPDVDAVDWPIGISLFEPPDPSERCILDVTADASGLGLDNDDGRLEVRVVNGSATGRFSASFRQTLRLVDFFAVPAGPYRVLARAAGGDTPGFGRSELMECDPSEGLVAVDVFVENASTRGLNGSWSGADELELSISQPLADPDDSSFDWLAYPILHEFEAGDELFTATVLDGETDGPLQYAGCRAGSPGRACVNRTAPADATSLEVGELPGHLLVQGRVGSDALTVQTERELVDGSLTATIIDTEDLFEIRDIWTGWSPTGTIEVPTAWLDELPSPELLTVRSVAREGVEFDYAAGFLPSEEPDGWLEFRPAPSELSAGQ